MSNNRRVLAGIGLTLLLVLMVIAAPAAAAPRRDRGLTIAAAPRELSAGESVLIYGRLAGPADAHRWVWLFHRIGAARRLTPVGRTRTDAAGFYEFVRADGVVTTNRSWFVRSRGGAHSRTINERVAAVVTLNRVATSATTAQTVSFSGTVYPAHFARRVVLQEQDSAYGNGWRTIAAGRAFGPSGFTIEHRFRAPGDYTLRAVLPARARNIQSPSQPVSLTVQQQQNPSFTIAASQPVIGDGGQVTITGTLLAPGSTTAGAPGVTVTLYGRPPFGRPRALASTTTGASGSYSFTQTPLRDTVYHVLAASQRTANLYVGVQDAVSAALSSATVAIGEPVTVSGTVTPSHGGHLIYLQEQTAAGRWVYVAVGRVRPNSTFALHYTPGQDGVLSLRVQITGGPFNVGADSSVLALTVAGTAPASTLPPAT